VSNVKGSALASRLLWVRLGHGEQGLERLEAAASPALQPVLVNGVVMARWYPFELFVELIEVIDRLFGKGDLALVWELGRFGADANLKTVYRLFYKVGTVRWILGRAARLWGVHYDSGRLEVITDRPGESIMEIVDFDTPHRVHCMSVAGWAEKSVEISGGKDAKVVELECRARGEARCVMKATWK
jgi:hypothetical protein